jgi:hypothetical protein
MEGTAWVIPKWSLRFRFLQHIPILTLSSIYSYYLSRPSHFLRRLQRQHCVAALRPIQRYAWLKSSVSRKSQTYFNALLPYNSHHLAFNWNHLVLLAIISHSTGITYFYWPSLRTQLESLTFTSHHFALNCNHLLLLAITSHSTAITYFY